MAKPLLFYIPKLFLCIFILIAIHVWSSNEKPTKTRNFSAYRRSLLQDVDSTCEGIADLPKDQQCDFAKTYCADSVAGGLLNYMVFRYCTMEKYPALAFVIIALWTLVLFYLLGNTAEDYFCPSLTRISDALKLSPTVAGVTLLALGNGASDIATILVGVFNPSVSQIGIAEPIGAGAFITTAIVGSVALISSPVELSKGSFLRDIISYLLACVFVFVVAMDNKVNVWEAVGFLLVYAAYVVIVVVGDRIATKRRSVSLDNVISINDGGEQDAKSATDAQLTPPAITNHDAESEQNGPQQVHVNVDGTAATISHRLKKGEHQQQEKSNLLANSPKSDDGSSLYGTRRPSVNLEKGEHVRTDPEVNASVAVSELNYEDHHHQHLHTHVQGSTFKSMLEDAWRQLADDCKEGLQNGSLASRVAYPFEAILRLVRNLTIPNADEESWVKLLAVLVPIGALQYLLFSFQQMSLTLGGSTFPLWALLLLIGTCFSVFVFKTSKDEAPPSYHMVYVVACFLCSIAWLYLSANELVEVVSSIGIMFGMSNTLLGVTVLALGNSVGDFAADLAVARKGYASMAVAACYGGPMLNLLLGLGLSFTASCAISYPDPYPLVTDSTVTLAFVCVFVVLALTLVVVPLSKFHIKKWFGACLVALYILFMTLDVLADQKILFK